MQHASSFLDLSIFSPHKAAHQKCLEWSPDLKVTVNASEQAITVDYCTDSASPQTYTCITEVNSSSTSAAQCHTLDQVKPYCRCQERIKDPCAVTVFHGKAPYHIPAPSLTLEPTGDDKNGNVKS
ncbi:hypothetical protein ElyMa_005878500 [Elysia marginata]|uniref:Phlebovirus glycoprotein G2 fusion domain-containing protein n=1 Tax=Elysia marginata TaxID=1093978 RepID=A0AAV4G1Y1_9GAST|nr:hypothetical protein ElyMa_005878500 [Elysia marginata]